MARISMLGGSSGFKSQSIDGKFAQIVMGLLFLNFMIPLVSSPKNQLYLVLSLVIVWLIVSVSSKINRGWEYQKPSTQDFWKALRIVIGASLFLAVGYNIMLAFSSSSSGVIPLFAWPALPWEIDLLSGRIDSRFCSFFYAGMTMGIYNILYVLNFVEKPSREHVGITN